ncbi:MAG: ExeA family protein [Candidatus Binatia bacterium]
MYTTYFGFHDEPFSLTPAPHFFYANVVYKDVYGKLLEGIRNHKGIMVLTGEVGAGKTTLLRRLLDTLAEDPAIHTIFSYYSTLSFEDFFSFICQDLGLTRTEEGDTADVQVFSAFLHARAQAGETIALLIDEAQDLREDVLERLFAFSETQQMKGAPLQILFVGQYPELDDKLNRPRFRRLKQAIALRCQLVHLGTHEVSAFIHHRLRLVGYERQDLFSPEALRLITRYSQGNPRLINLLCDNALRATQAASQATVSATTLQKVARTLRLVDELAVGQEEERKQGNVLTKAESPATGVSRPFIWSRRVAVLLLLLGLSFSTLRGGLGKNPFKEDPASSNVQQKIQGQAIFARIAVHHPDIRPLVWGLATETPALALLLPEREWWRLTKDEQVALTLYMESLIPAVRANPESYLEEFRATPVYDVFHRKVAHLCADCWVIGSGELSQSRTAAFFDRILVQGDSLWNKSLAGGQGVRASEFRTIR